MSQATLQTNSRPDDEALRIALANIVGHEHVRSSMSTEDAKQYTVDGVAPQAVVFPASQSEVAQILSYANEAGLKVSPRGGGTQTGLGNIPSEVNIVLGLERLNRIVAHEPADMTVTVEAGLPLADLQAALARAGQFLPIDPPIGDTTTIGGVLATRAFGPLRFGYRTISDFLLGIQVVTAQGQRAKSGGRVVKNVSGYELSRVYTGSMGTLAVIVEATFKVQPLPRDRSILIMPCADMSVAQKYVRALIECGVQPVLFELITSGDEQTELARRLNQEAKQDGNQVNPHSTTVLAVGFMGTDEEVAWQVERSRQTLEELSTPPQFVAALTWDDAYPHIVSAHRGPKSGVITCRVHMKDTQLYDYLERIRQDNENPGAHPIALAAHAGSGVARVHIPLARQQSGDDAGHGENEAALQAVASLRERAEAVGGRLIIETAPLWLKKSIDVWGTTGADFFLHQAVKDKMDPKRLLNPGRFIGGI